jgi:uncharacterized protein (TIGR03000 family)
MRFLSFVLLALLPAVAVAQGIVTPYKPPVIPPGSPGSIPPLPGRPFPGLPPLPGLYPLPGVVWYPWYWQPQPIVVVNTPVVVPAVSPRSPDMPSIAFAEVPATLKLQFPAAAEVWVDGVKSADPPTASRDLASAPIKLGAEHTFRVKARWTLDGTTYEVERTSTVAAGGSKKLLVVSGTPVK